VSATGTHALETAVDAWAQLTGRVDGRPSETVMNAVAAFSWPPTKTMYIFKQYYVIERVARS
jgi:hypothetical protein